MKNYEEIYENYISHFSQERVELLVYNERDFNRSCSFYKGEIERHFNNYIAYRDVRTGEICAVDGTFEVPIDKNHFRKNKKCKLRAGKIYRLALRPCISDELSFRKERQFMLEEILEKDVRDAELLETVKNALAPFHIHEEGIGEFEWRRSYGCSSFVGSITWCGAPVDVELSPDGPGIRTADVALGILKKIFADQQDITKRMFEALADECADEEGLIPIWDEEESRLTRETFVSRLSVVDITVDEEGEVSFILDLDEMFTDHAQEMALLPDGTIEVGGLMG